MAKLLSPEEIKLYLNEWQVYRDEKAAQILIESNQNLVKYFAKKFLQKGLSFDELMSAGNVGLFNAISKFNYVEKDIDKFSSYISIAIQNEMILELRKYNKHSHVLSFDAPIYESKDGDELTIEDIVGTDGDELLENVISNMKIEIVREALKSLTSTEKQIILLHYGLDEKHKKTLTEIGDILGYSQAYVSRMEQKALIKMRHPRNTKKLKDFIEE